uniref:Uncharacterized protein n=1 Tax=Trichobilharzia regenti TaxID=157069 RepID=A0AA85K455_TRIRE|nr:unnamed protein product [Trichobilharzia regenti]
MPMKMMSYPVIIIFILHLSTIKSNPDENLSPDEPPNDKITEKTNTMEETDGNLTTFTNYSSSADAFVSTSRPVNNDAQTDNRAIRKEEVQTTNETVPETHKTEQQIEDTIVEQIPEEITNETQNAGKEDGNTQSIPDAAAVAITAEQETQTAIVETNSTKQEAETQMDINTSVASSGATNMTYVLNENSSFEKANAYDEEKTTEKSQIVTESTEKHPHPIRALNPAIILLMVCVCILSVSGIASIIYCALQTGFRDNPTLIRLKVFGQNTPYTTFSNENL